MEITKAKYLGFAKNINELPEEKYPEIALAGRSNVGKSSLINVLVREKNFARTSNTPGKTRGLFFYLINDDFCLVDFPGYGYAKVSHQLKKHWASFIEDFLSTRNSLTMFIHVVDLRHPPSEDDKQMAEWLRHFSFPVLTVATKTDKIARGKRDKHLRIIAEDLEVSPKEIILFSAHTGEGRKEVLKKLGDFFS